MHPSWLCVTTQLGRAPMAAGGDFPCWCCMQPGNAPSQFHSHRCMDNECVSSADWECAQAYRTWSAPRKRSWPRYRECARWSLSVCPDMQRPEVHKISAAHHNTAGLCLAVWAASSLVHLMVGLFGMAVGTAAVAALCNR